MSQRIRLRGRRMEQDIPLSYLKRLEGLLPSTLKRNNQ
jgi:deoxyadenosine/deoxycytidine kinase